MKQHHISNNGDVKTDVQLQRDVMDELDWDPSIDASQIGVSVSEGIATLTGHVEVYAEKHAAEEVAKHVHGIRAIANEIEVRPADSHHRDDADIAAAAIHALDWHSKIPHEGVQVIVDHGNLTLEGTVQWQYQRMVAEQIVRHLNGVREVRNSLRVQHEPPVKHDDVDAELTEHVRAALQRSARLRIKPIDIEIRRGIATLTGDVHSLAERDAAERMVWSARGVCNVENCITVTPWGSGPAEEWGY